MTNLMFAILMVLRLHRRPHWSALPNSLDAPVLRKGQYLCVRSVFGRLFVLPVECWWWFNWRNVEDVEGCVQDIIVDMAAIQSWLVVRKYV